MSSGDARFGARGSVPLRIVVDIDVVVALQTSYIERDGLHRDENSGRELVTRALCLG